jgi:hypothetical protein
MKLTHDLPPDATNEPLNLRMMIRAAVADTQFEMQHSHTPLQRCRAGVLGYTAILRLVVVSPFVMRSNTWRLVAALLFAAVGSGLLLFSTPQNIFRGELFGSAVVVTWLTSRRPYAFRVVGHMIAAAVIPFCAWLDTHFACRWRTQGCHHDRRLCSRDRIDVSSHAAQRAACRELAGD